MGSMEICRSRSWSPIPAVYTTASGDRERMVRERREENRAMGSMEIPCSQSSIPVASRLRAEMVKGWCRRGGRRTAGDGGLGNGFCPDLGGDNGKRRWWKAGVGEVVWERREGNDKRWGAWEWVPSRSGKRRRRGKDGERSMRERWCGRGGRRMTGDEGLRNSFRSDLGGNDEKRRWWKAGAGEEGGEQQEIRGSGMGSVQIWEATMGSGDGGRLVRERWCERGGRRTVEDGGLENGFRPDLEGDDGKWR